MALSRPSTAVAANLADDRRRPAEVIEHLKLETLLFDGIGSFDCGMRIALPFSITFPSEIVMHVELTTADAQFLHKHLLRHLKGLEDELVHTDKSELQHALAADARHLRQLIDRLIPA